MGHKGTIFALVAAAPPTYNTRFHYFRPRAAHESPFERQAHLRKLQDRAPPRAPLRHLQQSTAQAAPGVRGLSEKGTGPLGRVDDKDQKGSEGSCPLFGQPQGDSMPRILGVDIPNDKPTHISLRYIYGIGPTTALQLCVKAKVDPQRRAKDLTEDDISRLAGILDREYTVEGPLRRQVQQNIARLRDIGCYRGLRHRRGLPVRGQRTKTNARTRKGPRKTVAGKKGVKELRG